MLFISVYHAHLSADYCAHASTTQANMSRHSVYTHNDWRDVRPLMIPSGSVVIWLFFRSLRRHMRDQCCAMAASCVLVWPCKRMPYRPWMWFFKGKLFKGKRISTWIFMCECTYVCVCAYIYIYIYIYIYKHIYAHTSTLTCTDATRKQHQCPWTVNLYTTSHLFCSQAKEKCTPLSSHDYSQCAKRREAFKRTRRQRCDLISIKASAN